MLDFSEVSKDNVLPTTIPTGDYRIVPVKVAEKDTASGEGRYIRITFEVMDGEYEGFQLSDLWCLQHTKPDTAKWAKQRFNKYLAASDINIKQAEDVLDIPVMAHIFLETDLSKCFRDEPESQIKRYFAPADGLKDPVVPAKPDF